MSRIKKLFAEKQKNLLSIYCTAGYPRLPDTVPVIKALDDAGVDMMELGIPYSDPLADGPVIQGSNGVALANGMSLALLFSELEHFRDQVQIPVLLMGYLNPVLQYGFDDFCREAAACGVDGLIIPDLPVYEFEKTYQAIVDKYGLDFVFLVTPETSTERIHKLDSLSSGFLYAVTASSTTGSATSRELSNAFLKRLSEMELKNPKIF